MIFQHTHEQVLSGQKTQTRRVWKPGHELRMERNVWALYLNGRKRHYAGQQLMVQPGRGQRGVHCIIITRVRYIEDVRQISDEDVQAEGFVSRDEFLALWESMHGQKHEAYMLEFRLGCESI